MTLSITADDTTNRPELPNGAHWNDDQTVTLTLRRPVSIPTSGAASETSLSELVFHDLTAGDLIDTMNAGNAGKTAAALIAASTRQRGPMGEKLIRAMSAPDFLSAQTILGVFINGGQTTTP